MAASKKIAIIGSGNVATHLKTALKKAGHKIIAVKGRSKISAIGKTADLYILAIKDDAIDSVVKQLKLASKIVVHTSGSISIDTLKDSSKNIAVLYPLQTFSKHKAIDFNNVPIFVEANNKQTLSILIQIAKSISSNIHSISSKQRQVLHLAAVFACNFSNHMYELASQVLKKNNIPFNVLIPLIDETANKIHFGSPAEMQTGPAIRRDKKIIKKHLKLLSKNKNAKKIYAQLTKSIQKIK